MLSGLITTKDVIYFILIVTLFLGFTLLKLKGAKQIMPWFVKAGRYIALLAIILLLGYCTSRPAFIGYWDTTEGNWNTLHPNAQQILKELGDDPLEVTLYINLLE